MAAAASHDDHSHEHGHNEHSHEHDDNSNNNSSSCNNNSNVNNNVQKKKSYDGCSNNNNNNNNSSHGGNNDNDNGDDNERDEKTNVLRRLYIATALCGTFLMVEVVGGWYSRSLAILSDAAHLLADLCSFAVAICASHLARMPSSEFHTYGLKRAESLAALLSMVSLALVSMGLAWEAVRRLFFVAEPNQVNGQLMSGIAAIGVGVNIVLALVLGEHHAHMPGSDHHHGHDHAHGDHGDHGHGEHDDDEHGGGHDNHDHDHGHQHGHNGSNGGCTGHDHNYAKFSPEAAIARTTAAAVAATTEHTALLVHNDDDDDAHGHAHDQVTEKHRHQQPQPQHQPLQHQQQQRNVNLHAAYLHVMGDLAQSAAVLLAGLIIYWQPTWHVVDPICTLLFCTLVLVSTIPVIRSSVAVLIEEVPRHVDWKAVHDAIQNVDNVSGVHDLHIWSISHGVPGLSVHCFVQTTGDADATIDAMVTIQQQALRDIHAVCIQHGISHVTIQAQLLTSTSTLPLTVSEATYTADDEMLATLDCITCAEDPTCVQRSQIV